ncbi:ankyrin repeat domain-containing protein [Endozoicomonas sp. GU-1]|uniref:ankyrin repeat domain-containing protein n=1 Tax=Endozoicomonas sp. GU-1 TaxID=3009078 RepID=UPI0022B588D0|nr:ankyrin repeat domain-containing protein [Endozoicomonas sp. GU-1]WBA79896.1 ankyrin repeat domain-containing protein [Endozoicomonas sp. GU-1]WBA87471.1 ankyrin repeat domain-containing protein [Endozoicomonas sp. GU-1]
MNSVRGNATGLSFNCPLCDSGDLPIGQHDKRLVKASCPDSHVFHWKCITKWFDSEQQAANSLGQRKCSQCNQQAEPFILMSGDTVPGKYSSYCKSLDTPVFKDNTGRAKNDPSLGKMDKQGNTTLHEAVLRGSKEKVEEILRDTSSLNLVKMKNNKGETAFDMAVRRNQAKIVEVFMKKDETLAWKDGTSALHKAAEFNSSETVKVLLTMAPALDKIRNKDNKTALQIATDKGYTKTLNVFKEFTVSLADHEKGSSTLTTNMELDGTDKADKTAQAGSVVTSDPVPTDTAVDSRKKPLNEGASAVVNGKFCTSSTLINRKTIEQENDIGCLRELTDMDNRGVDFNARENDGITPLMEVDVNVKTRIDGATPLPMAAQNGHSESARELLKKYQTSVNDSCTALHLAARNGHTEAVKAMLAINPSLAKDNDSISKAIEYAAFNGHEDTVKTFLSINPSLEPTVFRSAIAGNLAEVVDVFLRINPSLARQQMALHLATANNSRRTVDVLLRFDISLAKVRDGNGHSALDIAIIRKNTHIAETMLNIDRDLAQQENNKNQTPLHLAALHGVTAVVERLLGIDRNQVYREDENGNRPLYYAAKKGHTQIIRQLLNIDQTLAFHKIGDNMTALHIAACGGQKDAVNALLDIDRPLAEFLAKIRVGPNGVMPIHRAALGGHTDVLNALLAFNPTLAKERDINGNKALDFAIRMNQTGAIKLLQNRAQACLLL